MAIPTFIQKSRINQVIYQIQDGHLLVSSRELWGKFKDYKFALRQLDPEYEPKIARNYFTLVTALVVAALCAAVIWGIARQTLIPKEASFFFYQWPAIGFAAFLAVAIRWSRRMEYYQFKTRAGRPAFSIIREREQAQECADFITTLVAHIQITQAGLPLEEHNKLLREFVSKDDSLELSPGKNKWLFSLVLGGIAAGFPLIPAVDYANDPSLFPIIFLLCAGAATLCIFSFLSNEPKRLWSVLGFALSLIPPLFY